MSEELEIQNPHLNNSSSITTALTQQNDISEELVWLENFTSKATRKTYKDGLKKFCKILGVENIDALRQINSMHIIKFRDEMKRLNEKNATINNRLSALSSLFKHLIEKQIVKNNPVYGVRKMTKDRVKVKSRALLGSEVDAILKQPNSDKLVGLRDKAILSIMFNLGTRVGTLANLRGRDIFEENGYLIIDMHLKGDKRNLVAANSHIQAGLKNYFEKMGYYQKDALGKVHLKG